MSKTIVKKPKWKKVPVSTDLFGNTGGGNVILSNDELLISYQDFKKGGRNESYETIKEIVTGDTRRDDETALYDRATDTWRILWGDHRKAYEKVFPDLNACLKVYKKLKPKYGCDKWSTDND